MMDPEKATYSPNFKFRYPLPWSHDHIWDAWLVAYIYGHLQHMSCDHILLPVSGKNSEQWVFLINMVLVLQLQHLINRLLSNKGCKLVKLGLVT